MDLPLSSRNCSDGLLRGSCNHFAVTADKRLCMVDELAGLFLCVRVSIYICVCVCVYMYIYILQLHELAAVFAQVQRKSRSC
jgi:hypothetical protein